MQCMLNVGCTGFAVHLNYRYTPYAIVVLLVVLQCTPNAPRTGKMPFNLTNEKNGIHADSPLYDFFSSDFLSSLNFGQVTSRHTDIQTEYDAYEPTVHTHRWAQKGNPKNNFKLLGGLGSKILKFLEVPISYTKIKFYTIIPLTCNTILQLSITCILQKNSS